MNGGTACATATASEAFRGAAWIGCTPVEYTQGVALVSAEGKLGRVAKGRIVYYVIDVQNLSEITIRCSPVRNTSSDPDLIVAQGQR